LSGNIDAHRILIMGYTASAYKPLQRVHGYGGWQNTFVLPSILVDMRSYTRLEAPELTVNLPPFEQSMERLNALLKSIRLRPTEPAMPELANLPAK
jgi:hypothetical protein